MRGFIFIWWSCGPLFPEWIIRICRCWALFIFSAVAESIRSILHTIFKIIQDRQHNSHSIRIQMTSDGGTTHSKTNTADSQCCDWLSRGHLTTFTQTVLFLRLSPQGNLYPCLVWGSCLVRSWSKIMHVINWGIMWAWRWLNAFFSFSFLTFTHMSIITIMCRVYQSYL